MTERRGPSIWTGRCLLAICLAGCSKPEATAPAAVVPTERPALAAAAPAAPPAPLKACEIVDAAAMTSILGGAVVAEGRGESKCTYTATTGASPYAELEIERGDGEVAMKAMGLMNRHEPGISDPLAGLGDQAAQVGPAFFIRSGADLVKVVFSGVDDPGTKARAVFERVKPKL